MKVRQRTCCYNSLFEQILSQHLTITLSRVPNDREKIHRFLPKMTLVPQDNLDDPQPLPEGRLRGRVAVITGASSGIGRAIAFRFSREGAKIVCADLQPDCESIGSRLQDSGFRTDE